MSWPWRGHALSEVGAEHLLAVIGRDETLDDVAGNGLVAMVPAIALSIECLIRVLISTTSPGFAVLGTTMRADVMLMDLASVDAR